MQRNNYQYDMAYQKLLSDFNNLQALYYEQDSFLKREKESLSSINNEKLKKIENGYKKLLIEEKQKMEQLVLEKEHDLIRVRTENENLKKYIENLENDCRKVEFTYQKNLKKEVDSIELGFNKKLEALKASNLCSIKEKEDLFSSLQSENERIFNELEENKGKYHFLFLSNKEMKEGYEKKIVILEKELVLRDDIIKKLNDDFSSKNKMVEKIEGEINELKDRIFSEKIEKDKKFRRKLFEKEESRRNQVNEVKIKEEEIDRLNHENQRMLADNKNLKEYYENLIEKLKMNISNNISELVNKKMEETREYTPVKVEKNPSKFIAKYI